MRKLYHKVSLASLLMLFCTSFLLAQERTVSGTVTDETGTPVPGVNILIKGTNNGTVTDTDGKYRLSVPGNDAILVFSFVGYSTREAVVGTQSILDVALTGDAQTLTELVVTGYSVERKRDIVGSVAVVSTQELLQTPAPSLVAQLQGRAAGVTVSTIGQPGGNANIRIRGFTTFGNNDPLYIIDGVPTLNPDRINPQDIESLQILKDAASASIYGARAANGVIIITTKHGKAGSSKITYDSFFGVQQFEDSGFPKMMNTEEYANFIWRVNGGAPASGHRIFGSGPTPVIPEFLINSKDPLEQGGSSTNPLLNNPERYSLDPTNPFQVYATSAGTDWFREITQPGRIQSHQISASGGSNFGTYAIGFNYFDQDGTIIHSNYKRGTLRANTLFNIKEGIRVGENLQVSYEHRTGGAVGDPRGEGQPWSMAFRMVPYIPVYDLNGGFAGNAIGDSGNGSNPVADVTRTKNDRSFGYRIFGNTFAEVDFLKNFTARTSFGVDYDNDYIQEYTARTYEKSENVDPNRFEENYDYDLSWVWTNTLQFNKSFNNVHNFKALIGTEAVKSTGRYLEVTRENYDLSSPDFLGAGTGQGTPNVTNNTDQAYPDTYRETLYSIFARADYSYNDRYLLNATVRRDGSSKLAPGNQFGVFPAFGAGWRISEEAFMSGVDFITDLKLRASWGQMGSLKNVSTVNQYTIYSASPEYWYAINGQNNSANISYRQTRLGNANTRWETAQTTNFGFDASLLAGKIDLSLDVFNTKTKDLLVERRAAPVEPVAFQPLMNVGTMVNQGFDFRVGYRTTIRSQLELNTSVTFTHYTNEVTKLDAEGSAFITQSDRSRRQTGILRTQAGQAMSSFYGYQLDGFYDSQEEIDNSPAYGNARIGGWKIKDLDGNDVINENDMTFLGSPIPDFQMGFNIGLSYKNFDFNTFLFWNYGNEIYNFTKYFTHLRGFIGGVSTEVPSQSWTPETASSATLPSLVPGDAVSRSIVSDYYIESGSYFRAKTIQLGYRLPSAITSKLKIDNLRVYVQAQNLFTITNYSGADPDINIQNREVNGRNSDINMGIDEAGYPNSKQFLIGLNLGF